MFEKVLLVCTSTESKITGAVSVLRERVFKTPRIDLLCTLRDLAVYEKSEDYREVLVFPPRSQIGAILSLRGRIRHERYHAVVVLWCMDPGRTRPKLFALACGWPRLLVFNENLDCDYLGPRFLWRFWRSRARDGKLFPSTSTWTQVLLRPARVCGLTFLRVLFFPVRLIFLLVFTAGLYLGCILKDRNRNVKPG
ncbi:MAG TPA: hypothetical protein VMW38_10035 [Terriglobia bacterium]|nr:hypothetical protein [Terriglobia bacterium]